MVASPTSFPSAVRVVRGLQPISLDGGSRQIFRSKPTSLTTAANPSLRMKKPTHHEFTTTFLIPCSTRRVIPSPWAAYRFSEAELSDLYRHARVTSSEEELQKIVEIEHLMKINNREFNEVALEVIAYSIELAKEKQQHVVETEHLMRAIFNCHDYLAELFLKNSYAGPLEFYVAGVHDTTPMIEATDKFIQSQPSSSSKDAVVRQGPYLESLIQRAIELKKECGEKIVFVDHLVGALAQDERFGKQLMKDFQISHQFLHDSILQPKTTLVSFMNSVAPEYDMSYFLTTSIPPRYITIEEEKLEACLNKEYPRGSLSPVYYQLIKQKVSSSCTEELYLESLQHQIESDLMPSARCDQSDSYVGVLVEWISRWYHSKRRSCSARGI
nr:chaperone protein ClpB3, chloroplastic-like isoform X4 [Ziziphus jujuba var. spinosa]